MDEGGRGEPALPLQATRGHGSLPDAHDVRPVHKLVPPGVRQAEGVRGRLALRRGSRPSRDTKIGGYGGTIVSVRWQAFHPAVVNRTTVP